MRIGVDGCKGGWCVVTCHPKGWEVFVISEIDEVMGLSELEVALIDIPIGLASQGVSRDIDREGRSELGKGWSSSIFSPPCREAIILSDYKSALVANRRILDKGFSVQAWNICHKIKEVDSFLMKNDIHRFILKEAHPEIVFRFLNNRSPLCHKKKTSEGIDERLDILSIWKKDIRDIYDKAILSIKRKEAAKDDIVDALGLAMAAELSHTYGLSTLSSDQIDGRGITMNLHYTYPYA